MYRLARLLFVLSLATLAFNVAVLCILMGPCALLLVAASVALILAKSQWGRLTTLGSAQWATREHLEAAGMLKASSGPVLGRVDPLPFGSVINRFLSAHCDSETAFDDLWIALRRKPAPILRLPRAVHTVYFAPSGVGKGVSCVVPFLMTSPDSCVVIDFKGENALLTAAHRAREFGHKIVVLDPFQVATKESDTFNQLDFIDPQSPYALDECNALAKALVVRTGEEKEPHWNDSAELWIAAFIAVVVYFGDRDRTRSLQTVREMLCDPDRMQLALKLMRESDVWSGMLARMGGQLAHFEARERSSTLTTVSRHLRFLDTQTIAVSTGTSTFDPRELSRGKATVYLILPPDHMRAQSALLRMWISSLFRAVIRDGLGEHRKVHFVLDEAASLGALECVEDAIDKLRGYGVRLHLFYQSMGQLQKCFPAGQSQTLLSNCSQVYFGVNDNQTAEYVSTRLGEQTIIVESGGTSSGTSWQSSSGSQASESSSGSRNTSHNWSQTARKLLKPEEVMALPQRAAITFTPGVPPIISTLIRYFEEPSLGKRTSWLQTKWNASTTLFASAAWLSLMVVVALMLCEAANSQQSQQPAQVPVQHQPVQRWPGGPGGGVQPTWQRR
ncbi:type IV secretory system conjugative DNA transfer family protein [Anatilimnocola floriformis]|uniref:type IV secretory system conjugative DNA transfer family protein n=1 Tax=Anatilimnocola floriformis TaxID=2948575 RepID=UPI0020C1D593|nr:type IV secretory system conjugative DNA transfer family protein [Anatilimnocola floriformis]